MKFLVVLLVVVVVLWFSLRRDTRAAAARRNAPRPLQNMVRCAHCGVHLPQDEAVAGHDGLYCSEAHRVLGHRQA